MRATERRSTVLRLCAVAVLLLSGVTGAAQEYRLPTDSILDGKVSILQVQYRFSPDDSVGFAQPDYDDRQWALSPSLLESGDYPPGWDGFGWYRMHLTVPPELVGEPIAIRIGLLGAAEVYVDGHLRLTIGTVGHSAATEEGVYVDGSDAVTVTPDSSGSVLLAIRHSSYDILEAVPQGQSKGFMVSIGHQERAGNWVYEHELQTVRHQARYTALALALMGIHLLLWLFYRPLTENRDFAVAALFLAGIMYFPSGIDQSESLREFVVRIKLSQLMMIGVTIAIVHFVHRLFLDRYGLVFKLLVPIGGVLALLVLSWPDWLWRHLFDLFVLAGFVETVRVNFLAYRQKKPGAKLIGSGFAVLTITSVVSMFSYLPVFHFMGEFSRFLYMYGFGVLMLTMSIHLARTFASTNIKLQRQLEAVRRLSQENLEQERRRLEESARREMLEKDLAHQRKELEEARKLETALRELERTNRELHATQAQLVQSEKMAALGKLVAGVSHEFNTPVGAVQSSSQNLATAVAQLNQTVQGDRAREDLPRLVTIIDQSCAVVQTGIDRIVEIVRRLKSFARLDEAQLKPVALDAAVQDVRDLLRYELERGGIRVTISSTLETPVVCFPGLLNQAVMNLMRRALHAVPSPGGQIDVVIAAQHDVVHIDISDNGEPLTDEAKDHVFDPSFAIEQGRMSMALDLAIAYQIVQRHLGSIEIETSADGTVFKLRFPIDLERRLQETQVLQ